MFAITGATGEIGRRVAIALSKQGFEQRLIVHDPTRAPDLPGATISRASSFSDAIAMGRAPSGTKTLFLASAHDITGIIVRHSRRGNPFSLG